MRNTVVYLGLSLLFLFTGGCGSELPLTPERYLGPDTLFDQIEANVAANPAWSKVAEIDHSRLGSEAGSAMPPARVLMFTDAALSAALLKLNPLVGVDLPLRVLAYESEADGQSKVIYNSYDYIEARYGLPEQPALRKEYEDAMAAAVRGIPAQNIAAFEKDRTETDGITTINSPYNFEETMERVQRAIASQDDTVSFGIVDFQAEAAEQGVELRSSSLILFGGPAPGAKAMSKAPTLGLDAFCQKFLVWEDEEGKIHLSFNDLLALGERQGVAKSVPLRVINFRLSSVFGGALEP
ncbi:MAG: hypothetical protein ACI9JM_002995 [Halioglobus sp.]|jgi:uncharacterized protein (DUF302 family)